MFMDLGVEERRPVIEMIATLAPIKRVMADFILKPAGIPSEIYQPILYRRDETTARMLSKRQLAAGGLAGLHTGQGREAQSRS
jgi:hypothetical protein